MTHVTTRENPDVIFVTGAGPGLGLAIARRFAREGFDVGLVARYQDRLDAAASELMAGGSITAVGVAADVSEPSSLSSALKRLADELGDATVLVANPSLFIPGAPTQVDPEAFVDGLRIGVVGALVALQSVAPAMRRRGSGTVLLTGGSSALRPMASSAALSAQKAALRNLAFGAAAELAPDGIHVGTVTIDGVIGKPGFAPEDIAEEFWKLHVQPLGSWTTETTFSRRPSN